MKRRVDTRNPWGLTELECAVLAALVEHGEQEPAAAALGVTVSSVMNSMHRIRQKMGVTGRWHVIREWLRWQASAAAAAPRTAWICGNCHGFGFLTTRPAA